MWNLRFQPCPPSSYRRGEKNIGLPGYNGTTGIMWEHRFYNFTDSIRVKSTHIYRSILPTLCATVLRVTYYEERGLNGGSEKGTLPSKSRFEGVESSRSVPSWWRKKRILDHARRTFFFAWRNEEKGEKERERRGTRRELHFLERVSRYLEQAGSLARKRYYREGKFSSYARRH